MKKKFLKILEQNRLKYDWEFNKGILLGWTKYDDFKNDIIEQVIKGIEKRRYGNLEVIITPKPRKSSHLYFSYHNLHYGTITYSMRLDV